MEHDMDAPLYVLIYIYKYIYRDTEIDQSGYMSHFTKT